MLGTSADCQRKATKLNALKPHVEQYDIDASEADRIFSILMGENVESRREFIAKNAIHVKNLDI